MTSSEYFLKDQPILREVAAFAGALGVRPVVAEQQVSFGTTPAKVARLVCTCFEYQMALRYPWCQHVANVINLEFDGKNEENFDSKCELPPVVEVPIFVHPPLAVPAVLTSGAIDNTRAVSVHGEHMGFIFIGQGRRSIRKLVIEWLVEKSVNLPVCTARHHYCTLPWERIGADAFDPRSKFHLTNLADLILTGQCRRCNEDNGVPDA